MVDPLPPTKCIGYVRFNLLPFTVSTPTAVWHLIIITHKWMMDIDRNMHMMRQIHDTQTRPRPVRTNSQLRAAGTYPRRTSSAPSPSSVPLDWKIKSLILQPFNYEIWMCESTYFLWSINFWYGSYELMEQQKKRICQCDGQEWQKMCIVEHTYVIRAFSGVRDVFWCLLNEPNRAIYISLERW